LPAPAPRVRAPVSHLRPTARTAGLSGGFSYSPVTGDLTVNGGKTATLAAGTYCFHGLTLAGGATLAVAGPVTIRLTGVLSLTGGSRLNPTGPPASLQLASSYAGPGGVSVGGASSTASLSVYAPRNDITVSDGAVVYGALLGKTLTVSGAGSAVHYDVEVAGVWDQ
jgi:hypothetical protein